MRRFRVSNDERLPDLSSSAAQLVPDSAVAFINSRSRSPANGSFAIATQSTASTKRSLVQHVPARSSEKAASEAENRSQFLPDPVHLGPSDVTSHAVAGGREQIVELLRAHLDQQRIVMRLIDRILQRRTQYEQEQGKVEHCQRFAAESMRSFMEAQRQAMIHRSFEAWYGELEELHERCESDQAALQTQQSTARRLQNDISTLEFRLMAQEDSLRSSTLSLLRNMGLDVPDSRDLSDINSIMAAEPSETPSLLAKYFDRKGDVAVIAERLQELDTIHREDRVDRNFLSDQGQPLESSDEQFEYDFKIQRQQLLQDLTTAEQDVEHLAVECRKADLDIEIKQEASSTGGDFDPRSLFPLPMPMPSRAYSRRVLPRGIATASALALTGRLHQSDTSNELRRRSDAAQPSIVDWLNNITAESSSTQKLSDLEPLYAQAPWKSPDIASTDSAKRGRSISLPARLTA